MRGLISLSLLTTAHPGTSQGSSVRSSTLCYQSFNLAMARSPPLRVHYLQLFALFTLGFPTPAWLNHLSLLQIMTLRPIMQKVRRHTEVLRPLVGNKFQVLLTPLTGVLFTFPSRYWYAIGRLVVFRLTRWSAQIHTGFHVSRITQDTTVLASGTQLSCSLVGFSKPFPFALCGVVLQPRKDKSLRFGLFRFRSPLLTESHSLSFPPVTKMFQFTGFALYAYVFNVQ